MISRRNFLKTQAAGVALPFALAGPEAKGESWKVSSTALSSGPDTQAGQPRIIDCHHHYNSDAGYQERLVSKLDGLDGMAFILTEPPDLQNAKNLIDRHPRRFAGFGELSLDDPQAVDLVDRFHDAGFRGLGELEYPRKNFDDRSYWPVYERAERYGMMILFHTGIVNRPHPEIPTDISSDRMRVTRLDLIARSFPKITVIGAHLGNPDYAWAAEIARWNPNLLFDLSGSSLIKKQDDYTFFKSVFWWSGVVSPHSPASVAHAFEKLVFASDCFGGDLDEFDLSLSRYQNLLAACNVPARAQANIFSGTAWRLLNKTSD
jgi:hypothetical protein